MSIFLPDLKKAPKVLDLRSAKTARVQNQAAAQHYIYQPCQSSFVTKQLKREIQDYIFASLPMIPWKIQEISYEPYGSYDEMYFSVIESRILKVSSLNSEHPVLTKAENFLLRAIHDYHHIAYSAPFGLEGEWTAYIHQAKGQSPFIRAFLRSEIYYQAAAKFYLGRYPVQKLILSTPGYGI